MIFGNQHHFGLEVAILPDESLLRYGVARYWAKSLPIGNFDEPEELDLIAKDLKHLASWTGKRTDPLLDGKSDQESLDLIMATIWVGYEPRSNISLEMTESLPSERFERFSICPRYSPPFDAWFATLIERGDNERFIWIDRPTGTLHAIDMKFGTYRNVIGEFLEWLAKVH